MSLNAEEYLKLKKASEATIDKMCFNRLTSGMTKVRNKYMYLDRNKYKGNGRPRISDYTDTQPLYINNIPIELNTELRMVGDCCATIYCKHGKE